MALKNTRQTSSRPSSSSTRGRGSMSPTTTTTNRKTTPRPSPRPSPKASPTPSYEDRSPDRDPITGKPVPNYLKHTLSSRHDHTCRYPDDKTKGSTSTATTPSPPGNSTKRTNNGAASRNERKLASQSISPKSRTLKTPSPSNLTSSTNKSTAFGRSMSSKTLRSGAEKSTTTTPLTSSSSSSMKMKKKQIDKGDQKVDTKVWPKAHSQSADSTKTQLGLQGEEVEKGITESNAGEKREVMMVEEKNVVLGGSPQSMEEEEVDEEHMHQDNDDNDDDNDENKNEGDNSEVDHPLNEEHAMEKVQEEEDQEGKEDEVIAHPVTATDEIASEHREEQKQPSVEDERDNKSAVSSEFEQQSLTSKDQSLASKKEDKVETEQAEVTHEETSKDAGKVIPDDKDAENDADDDEDEDGDFDDEEDEDQDDDVEVNGEQEAGEDGNSKVAFKQGSTGRLDDREETSKPKKMRFRKARALTDEEMKERQERRRLRRKEKAEKPEVDDDEQKQVEESVQLKPGTAKEKKEEVVYNQVIEETASKLQAQSRKNKVRALVGAFETVISYETDAKQRAP